MCGCSLIFNIGVTILFELEPCVDGSVYYVQGVLVDNDMHGGRLVGCL